MTFELTRKTQTACPGYVPGIDPGFSKEKSRILRPALISDQPFIDN
jgi:hypothetical protein